MDGCQKMELQTSNFDTADLEDEDPIDGFDGYYYEEEPDDEIQFK